MTDDRKYMEDKRFAVVSKDTIKMSAETVGYRDLPDEVADLLSEDVSYRLREVIQHSCHFLRHGRRKKLTSEDVNRALKNSDTPPIFGHGGQEMLPFRQTKEAELYFLDDLDINLPNLSYSSQTVPQPGQAKLKAYWLAVDGIQKPGSIPQGLQAKVPAKTPTAVTEDMLQYYGSVTKAILGNEEEIMKFAFVDLRTNTKISPLMPYFINFFANGVRTVHHDVVQLTKLLHMVRGIISNQSLNLEPKPYLQMLVQGVLYCVLDPLAASINPLNDHWKLREYAARLLAIITRDWETPLNNLRENNIQALREVLYDMTRPFCSHYGAVVGLAAFGTQALEDVLLPFLVTYWPYLQASMEDTAAARVMVKADAHKVYGAILVAVEYVLKAKTAKVLADMNAKAEAAAVGASDVLRPTELPHSVTGLTEARDMGLPVDSNQKSPEMKFDPSTSTPIRGGIQLMDTAELVGPILQLPETSRDQDSSNPYLAELTTDPPDPPDPHKQLAQIYKDLYEYFGDSLAARCQVRYQQCAYIQKKLKVAPLVCEDEESKKSGEELLKQFLVADEGAGNMELDETDGKSENQSYEPTPDGMDYDLEEKSERSSRSARSLSDENLSYVGEDLNLTLKATVSDPSQGIKLTILKRPKLKMSEPMMEGDEEEQSKQVDDEDMLMPVLEPKPDPIHFEKISKVTKPKDIKEVFEIQPMVPNNVFFMFRFLGCEQLCSSKRNSNRMSAAEMITPKSEVKLLGTMFKMYGKLKCASSKKKTRRKMPPYFSTGNIEMLL